MAALSPVAEKFVRHWGEMGTRWGINRSVAQIHALLYIAPRPLHAEEIAESLGLARSNVSNSLKELLSWNLVRVVHLPRDRRDHFESLKDVWEMFQLILDERKRREIDPTVGLLRECVAAAQQAGPRESHARERLEAFLDFFTTMSNWYQQIRRLPSGAVLRIVKLGGKLPKLLGLSG
jgi:DNA-binding transcriptional regulator GbsR (MarR family)